MSLNEDNDRRRKRICVMCDCSRGQDPAYVRAARTLGQTSAARGIGIVYGGAGVRLVGALADAACDGGSQVIVIITPDLADLVGHDSARLEHVDRIHQRKDRFADGGSVTIACREHSGISDSQFRASSSTNKAVAPTPVLAGSRAPRCRAQVSLSAASNEATPCLVSWISRGVAHMMEGRLWFRALTGRVNPSASSGWRISWR